MYKLLFFIIIFSAGFSSIAQTQDSNKITTHQVVFNENSTHFKRTTDTVVVYRPQHEEGNYRVVTDTSAIRYYMFSEKTKEKTTAHSHTTSDKKSSPNNKGQNSNYFLINKQGDTIKVRKQKLVKDN